MKRREQQDVERGSHLHYGHPERLPHRGHFGFIPPRHICRLVPGNGSLAWDQAKIVLKTGEADSISRPEWFQICKKFKPPQKNSRPEDQLVSHLVKPIKG